MTLGLHAQGVDDAILNATTYYEGTGRSLAMGNATGAMGGDITATCINPAGLGLYRTGEMTFTTGLQHNLMRSSYYDNIQYAGKTNVSIPNFGYVLALECSNYKPLRFLQMAIGLTRTNDFGYRSNVQGMNPNSSFIDAYLQTLDGIDELYEPYSNVETYLSENYPYTLHPAWRAFLIDRFHDSLGYYFDSPIPPGNVNQYDKLTSKGRSEEWTFAISANIKEKLYIGTSMGLTHIKRISTRTYSETPQDPNDSHNSFKSWSFEEELKDNAWGINFKAGVIYSPIHWLRLGASWHTRTIYNFEENWNTTTTSQLLDSNLEDYYKYYSPTLYNDYVFRTPNSFIGSAAFLFGQRGMVTADLEYMNYGMSRFSSSVQSFSDANNDIKAILKPTCNLRIGTEWRYYQYFIRGGMAYYGSPYGLGDRYRSVKKLALGIGYATTSDVFWDFAYELTESTSGFTPYQCFVDGENIVSEAVQRQWRNKLVATMKIRL